MLVKGVQQYNRSICKHIPLLRMGFGLHDLTKYLHMQQCKPIQEGERGI